MQLIFFAFNWILVLEDFHGFVMLIQSLLNIHFDQNNVTRIMRIFFNYFCDPIVSGSFIKTRLRDCVRLECDGFRFYFNRMNHQIRTRTWDYEATTETRDQPQKRANKYTIVLCIFLILESSFSANGELTLLF